MKWAADLDTLEIMGAPEPLKEKARLRDGTTYKSPVWHRLQSEVDQLTEEMLDYQQRVPTLRTHERRGAAVPRCRGAASCLISLIGLVAAAVSIAGCVLGWWSWWWLTLAAAGIAAVIWRSRAEPT